MSTFTSYNGMTTTSRRAGIYVRVSSEEQIDGYSLDAQIRVARQYCVSQGWDVSHIYRDEGKSARTDDLRKRPQFAAMIDDAEAGSIDVIVVHKLDRLARNRRVAFDTFHRLSNAGVGFVSISENMDYSSPSGQLMLTMLVGLGQFYSDNLSIETRKGKAERKAQGKYNGLLPFGVAKDAHGDVVRCEENHSGLQLAFSTAADGKSDREVAEVLNSAGYRTTGNRGRNLFTKDTVRCMLTNRFYLGELPDGAGGWAPGIHEAVIDPDVFERAQEARRNNATGAAKVRRTHRRYSLTGLAVCGHCGGRMHFNTAPNGKPRYYCYQKNQASQCDQRSGMLELINEQIAAYLSTFELPEDIVDQLVVLFEATSSERDDSERTRAQLKQRLERLKQMYQWGDLEREEYQTERDRLQSELAQLRDSRDQAAALAEAATFLRNLPAAWERATPEQRNALAGTVFQEVEITDDRVTAVLPVPEFAPFFNLQILDTETGRATMAAPNPNVLRSGSDGIRTRDLSLDRAAC